MTPRCQEVVEPERAGKRWEVGWVRGMLGVAGLSRVWLWVGGRLWSQVAGEQVRTWNSPGPKWTGPKPQASLLDSGADF